MSLKFDPIKREAPFSEAEVPAVKWESWTWQMQNTLNTEADFSEVFELRSDEKEGFKHAPTVFKVATTPYYAALARDLEPIRRIVMPTGLEAKPSVGSQEMLDPLDENNHNPVSRIVHRYSDRVLFLITDICSVYCRFCTRKRFTGKAEGLADSKEYQDALHYIREHPGIREVIFSGGDPLTLSNKVLAKALHDVRSIDHVEVIRIGTRMPVVCPMRIDKELCQIIREYAPVYLMSHFSHPKELTSEAKEALALLVDHGIPVMNQMVLLNGVNNHAAVIQALNRRLLYLRVKPYYIFQCDPSEGTDHLRTSVESSERIQNELWGHMSGLSMPTLILDIPAGGGKAALVPDFLIKSEAGLREFAGWDGKRGVYKNPEGEELVPADAQDYVAEWTLLKNAKVTTVL